MNPQLLKMVDLSSSQTVNVYQRVAHLGPWNGKEAEDRASDASSLPDFGAAEADSDGAFWVMARPV